MRVTTETGSYYDIDGAFWSKNGGPHERLWWGYCVPSKGYTSWAEIYAAEHHEIQVGMSLYIGNSDIWWLSTKIVSIEDE